MTFETFASCSSGSSSRGGGGGSYGIAQCQSGETIAGACIENAYCGIIVIVVVGVGVGVVVIGGDGGVVLLRREGWNVALEHLGHFFGQTVSPLSHVLFVVRRPCIVNVFVFGGGDIAVGY